MCEYHVYDVSGATTELISKGILKSFMNPDENAVVTLYVLFDTFFGRMSNTSHSNTNRYDSKENVISSDTKRRLSDFGIEDGDIITIDAETNTLSVDITDELLKIRKSKWVQPPYKFTRGVLHKYIKSVATASEGCVTDS